jgi:nucleoside-diphosphate-sugar epimerase
MILLSGAGGFIGSALLNEMLDQGLKVSNYDSRTQNFNFYEGVNLNEIEIMILCGGYVSHGQTDKNNAKESEKSNRTLDSILSETYPRLRKIVYLSTTDVYKNFKSINEGSEIFISNLYTKIKLEQEKKIKKYCENKNIDSLILRIGNVYGPGEFNYNKFIPSIIRCGIHGQRFKMLVNPNETLQPLYIFDLIKCIALLSCSWEDTGIINLIGKNITTYGEIAKIVSSHLCLDIRTEPSLSSKERFFETARMSSLFRFQFTDLEVGLRNEIEYEKQRYTNI